MGEYARINVYSSYHNNMSKHSKRYLLNQEGLQKAPHTIDAGITTIKNTRKAKFDESVEVHVKLGIDPKKSEQTVRGSFSLPHGTGKKITVAVFTNSETSKAKDEGADIIGGKDFIDEIAKTGKTNFEVAVATPDIMKELAKIAKILGVKGLMPSPKTGTVTNDVAEAVKKIKAGQVNFRNDGAGNIHQIIGKLSWEAEKLKENFIAFTNEIKRLRPKGIKGAYIEGITLSSTMGPGVKIQA